MLELTDLKYENDVRFEEQVEKRDYYAVTAKFLFFMFVFFNIFGTSLPFRERVFDVTEIQTSNNITQIVYTLMFILSIIALIPKSRLLNSFVVSEKFLYLFLLWCAISLLWSDYSFVAFKRWFQLLTMVLAITTIVFYIKSDKDILKFFKPITAIFIVFSFISIFTIPEALDEYGVWRGLATSKNHLGQAALVSFLVWIFALKNSTILEKIFSFVIIGLAVVLLFGSESSTSIFAFIFLSLIGILFFIDREFKKINAGRFLSFIIIFSLITFIVYSFIATPELVNAFLGNFDEDITFTGRTFLWEDMLQEASKHWWLGTGFQSFWVITNEDLLKLYEIYIWLPNQSHNGYIDIINEVGLIGFGIFLMMIISYFIKAYKLHEPQIWTWFFVAALLINLQESTIFRGGVLTGVMFVYGYAVVKMRRFDQKRLQLEEQYEDAESNE